MNSRKIDFKDNRGRKIVYVSCCLLNQNAHTPGVATRKGAFNELIQMFLSNDIGIEQLPCMECRLWGGVSRKTIHTFQPLVLNSVGRVWFPFIEFCSTIEMGKTKYACRKEAKKVVKRIQDYLMEGYTIIGILEFFSLLPNGRIHNNRYSWGKWQPYLRCNDNNKLFRYGKK